MHSLTICFGPTGTIWTLLFKEKDTAVAAYQKMGEPHDPPSVVLSDDFGQEVAVPIIDIHGVMLDDMDQSLMAQVERGLHQARAQAKAQDRAMADPAIKESLRRQQMGPAVMSPVPGGRFNG